MAIFAVDGTFQKGDKLDLLKKGDLFALVKNSDGMRTLGSQSKKSPGRLTINGKGVAKAINAPLGKYIIGKLETISGEPGIVFDFATVGK